MTEILVVAFVVVLVVVALVVVLVVVALVVANTEQPTQGEYYYNSVHAAILLKTADIHKSCVHS